MRFIFNLIVTCMVLPVMAQQGVLRFSTPEYIDEVIQVKKQITVVVTFSTECPLCQSYTLTLNELQKKYASYGVKIIALFAYLENTPEELKRFVKRYKMVFPALRDKGGNFVSAFKPQVTPEAFVLDHKGNLLYQGRIDNWSYEVGRRRKIITTHDLDDALQAVVHHQPIKVKRTKAIGCYIEY